MISAQKTQTEENVIHPYEPELLVGKEAMEMLEKKAFQEDWDALYDNCTWRTLFQSRDFVTSWYSIYKEEYLPIIILKYTDQQLTGLLCMTTSIQGQNLKNSQHKGRIVGAGHYEAEYQSWLATQESSEEFILKSLDLLRTEFPRCDIYFRYLIPQVPLDWLSSSPRWDKKCIIQAYKRPIVRMDAPDISKLFRKKEFKNKFNRFKRLGNFVFDQITDTKQFSEALPIVIEQFEFRQRAMFNKSQFSDSPEKKQFLQALFEQGLLHVTVMKLNDEIVASVLGLKKDNWYHLGAINTHSPVYGNHSPGFVHFILLCELLSHDKAINFDLTPGGDAYKERMANDHDYVQELCIPHSPLFQKRQLLKYKFHDYLMKLNFRPMSIQLSLKKEKYKVKHWLKRIKSKGLKKTITDWQRQKTKTKEELFILKDSNHNPTTGLHLDKLDDLLNYEENQLGTSSWDFLNDSMQKFANEFHAITCSKNGTLLCLGWLVDPDRWEMVFNKKLPNNEKYPVLLGLEYHPAISDKLDQYVSGMAGFIKKHQNSPKVYLSIASEEQKLLQPLEPIALTEA